jgi:23S rRNA (cytosine1962-C5)-methyltransferase
VDYLPVYLKKHEDRRLRQGHLWVFSNEIDQQRSPLSEFQPGDRVTVLDAQSQALGVGYINPNALICVRLLSRKPSQKIGEAFFRSRFEQALALRSNWYREPYYRLVFGESDGLPGLVVDRFGSVLSVQIATQGMEQLKPLFLPILQQLIQPECIWLKNDSNQRRLESLSLESECWSGSLPPLVEVRENAARFVVDLRDAQKTGWFFDHRHNRAQLAHLVKGKRVLDLFSYIGAWGMPCALAGAEQVVCVDSSASALALARQSAELNGCAGVMQFERADVFDYLKQLREQRQLFDVVVLDPPALIKRKKDFKAGLEAYRQLHHLALQVLNMPGTLVSASCSHHLQRDQLHDLLRSSARHIDRHLLIHAFAGQGADHPVHPAIPETEYLKAFFCSVTHRF